MYDLCVALPGIRKANWNRLYESIITSIGDYTFQLILCSPESELPEELKEKENVKLITDFGSPSRAQQIACLNADSEYITWAADDGWFLPNKLKECLDLLKDSKADKKAVAAFYTEDNRAGLADYSCNYHEPVRSQHYPDSYVIYNCAIVQTDYFLSIGGFDCQFEVLPMAFTDYGVRSQRDGVETIVFTQPIFECTHTPGTTGDHAPIHYAQLDHDQPLYGMIYSDPHCVYRVKIDINNWKNSPERWTRRFG